MTKELTWECWQGESSHTYPQADLVVLLCILSWDALKGREGVEIIATSIIEGEYQILGKRVLGMAVLGVSFTTSRIN